MESVFLNLLNMSITAGWIVLAAVVLRLIFKRAPKAIMIVLWALVGIRLLLPVSIESVLSLIPSTQTVPQNILTAEIPKIDSGITAVNEIVNPILSGGAAASSPAQSASAGAEAAQAAAALATTQAASVNPIGITVGILSAVWLLGMVALFFYASLSFLRLKRRVEEAVLLRENVYLCDRVTSPFVLGLLRPKIFLPSDLPEEERTYVIAHEQAHIHRHDQIFKPLGFLLLAVYWFNPLMWVAYILFCRDIEFACDERVLLEMGTAVKKPYSEALIDCSVPRKMIAACPLAFGEVDVKNRVKSVLSYKKPAFWVVLLAIVSCIGVGVFFLTNPVKAQDEDRTVLYEAGNKGVVTMNANLPEGYTFRDTNAPEEFANAQERRQGGEKVGTYEILKDGQVIVYLYNRPENEAKNRKASLEQEKEQITSEGPGPKGIVFLEENTLSNGNYYLFYEYQYRNGTNAYVYVIDFPQGSKLSFELSTLDNREEAEKFFALLNLRYEEKDGTSFENTQSSEAAASEELIAQGRAILQQVHEKVITYRSDLPQGYTLRNNYDAEHREESQKRLARKEDFGFFEILNDGQPVVNITLQQENYSVEVRSMISQFQAESLSDPSGNTQKNIDYLEQKRRDDGSFYMLYYWNTNGKTKYVYVLDFPSGSESSIEIYGYDLEELKRFIDLLDFRCEDKANYTSAESESSEAAPSEPVSEPDPVSVPEPVSPEDWVEPDRSAGSFDYYDPTKGEKAYVLHIDYELPEGYEVTFPMLWMTYDNPRFTERMNNPTSEDYILKNPHEIEVSKDGVTVFAIQVVSKPRYYEVVLPAMLSANTPRQEAINFYYDSYEQFERADGTFLTAFELTFAPTKVITDNAFGGINLSSSKKYALILYGSEPDTAKLKEYASWFSFNMVKDPEGEVSGLLRRESDLLPIFGRATLESELGSVLASYYTFDGFEISYPRASDPTAQNDLEITRNGRTVYTAKIISKEEMQRLKAQFDADSSLNPEAPVGAYSNEQLQKVGKQEYDYKVKKETKHYYSLIDFLKSDTMAMYIESYTTADGSWDNSFFPYFTYTLLPLEE